MTDKERQIQKFIGESIKQNIANVDETKLQNLFDQMTTEEIQKFWLFYSGSKALSTANASVPYWKTKEQKQYFDNELDNYQFYPKEKDGHDKYIIDRNDLISHVKFHLKNIIKQQIKSNQEFKNKPFLEKCHSIFCF